MLHFFKSADCPRNDKGISKVARGTLKHYLWAQKTFKTDLKVSQ